MSQEYDVIIIGGGITGAATARDCAMRGLKTLVLEKRDFSAGTTGACMGLIHGGLQYVVSDFALTEHSCIESGIVQQLAPHLIFRIPWLHPFLEGGISELKRYGPAYPKYDSVAGLKYSQTHVLLSGDEVRKLEPALSPRVTGALTMDEPGISTFRLVVANLTAAAEHGATIRNHAQVTAILRDGNRVTGVRVRDTLTGDEEEYRSAYVANCAGPWTPWVAALAGIRFRLGPIKGIHIVFDRRVTNMAISTGGSEAHILPHENTSICGIANDFFHLNPDEVRADRNEVERLLIGLEMALPDIRKARIIRTMAGARPTLLDEGATNARAVSRDFKIFDHEELEGVKGFITIAGGKMVVARKMAETLTDVLCQKLGRDEPCRTAVEPFPGGEQVVDPAALAEEFGVPVHTATRIVYRHGARAHRVLELVRENPQTGSHVCVCEPVTEAEIRYCVRHEWVRTLDDLRRRTRLGMGPCQGCHCTRVAQSVLTDELDQSAERGHADVLDFLQSRWRGRVPGLTGTQLRQEELQRAIYLGVGGYDNPELGRTSRW